MPEPKSTIILAHIKNICDIYGNASGWQEKNHYVMKESYQKTIISLFDHSGNWSRPYNNNGWNVIKVDIKDGQDIMTWDYQSLNLKNVCIILAAIPCTDFALTGAASFAKKDADGTTENSILLVKKTIEIIEYYSGGWYQGGEDLIWCVENPMTRIHKLCPELGSVKFKFSPNEFAGWSSLPESNQYSKQTWLFGNFNPPIKKKLPSSINGLKWKDSKRGSKDKIKELRSITPDGFANAFYDANKYDIPK